MYGQPMIVVVGDYDDITQRGEKTDLVGGEGTQSHGKRGTGSFLRRIRSSSHRYGERERSRGERKRNFYNKSTTRIER